MSSIDFWGKYQPIIIKEERTIDQFSNYSIKFEFYELICKYFNNCLEFVNDFSK